MELNKILKEIEFVGNPDDREIKNITHDSRNVKDGSFFIALAGKNVDGHDFIKEAVKRGATAILSNGRKIKLKEVPLIQVKNPRVAMSHISANFYNHPSKDMVIIGVTGTNGKTSITQLVSNIFTESGHHNGTLGTLGFTSPTGIISTGFTTPESIEIHHMLKTLLNGGINYAVLEISSHSLEYHRVDDLDVDVAVFSNLTEEHLDFHGNMDAYYEAKLKLFKELDTSKYSVINIDDQYGEKIIKNTKSKIITYGLKNNADIYPIEINYSLDGINAHLNILGKSTEVTSSLIGEYNLLNIMAGIGVGVALDLPIKNIINGINKLETIPGRMEKIHTSLPGYYYVDYAHTPDAYKKIYTTIQKMTENRDIITVFGCGGDRDSKKRPLMANIAEQYSKYTFVTSDNPRTESLESIISNIISGFKSTNYSVVFNRKEAIHQAIEKSNKDSIVLILGKGRDNYEIIGHEKIFHSDIRTVQNYVR